MQLHSRVIEYSELALLVRDRYKAIEAIFEKLPLGSEPEKIKARQDAIDDMEELEKLAEDGLKMPLKRSTVSSVLNRLKTNITSIHSSQAN